jgi:uncharacterized membrane protein
MEDRVTQHALVGSADGMSNDRFAIGEDRLRAVAALQSELARILGPNAIMQPGTLHNVNTLEEEQLSLGDRIADWVANAVGSWRFITIQSIILALWISLNVVGWVQHWDPYPFILLNLALSFEAAYTAPIIMMSQNRASMKDRIRAEEDYKVNKLAEDEIRAVIAHLERQDQVLLYILERVERRQRRRTSRGTIARRVPTALSDRDQFK